MQAKRLMTAAVALGLGLGLTTTSQAETQIFLSEVGEIDAGVSPVNPDVSLNPGESGSLYVWVIPDGDQGLLGASLNLASSFSGVIDFDDAEVFNPRVVAANFGDAHLDEDEDFRWQSTTVGSVEADEITKIQGLSVTYGHGIDSELDGTQGSAGMLDELYDVSANAFLFGRIDFTAGDVGTTDLNLQINQSGIGPKEGTSADVDVLFGANEAESLNGSADRGVNSSSPDGSITVVPEPATLSLLALGGLVGLARRRK